MSFPTHRGFAALSTNEDGTTTVVVCAAIQDGRPVDVYAEHVGAADVRIAPGVRLTPGSPYRTTTKVVEVFPADNAVHVRTPRTGTP